MAAPPPVPKEKPVVLVAEDDPDLLRMITRMLDPIVTVKTAKDGQDALDQLGKMQRMPAVLVTDVMMPRLDGLALVKALKADPQMSRIPVIMLTAKGGPRDQIAGINAGVRHYLTKPFKHEDLVDKIKKLANVK